MNRTTRRYMDQQARDEAIYLATGGTLLCIYLGICLALLTL